MALRFSTALRDGINGAASLAQLLNGGALRLFTGSQPSSADDAETGTLLCTYTLAAAARTNEVLPTATVTLSGSGGQIDTATLAGIDLINAAVPYNTSLTQTAEDLATAINRARLFPGVTAVGSGATVILTAPKGTGDAFGGVAFNVTVSGGTLAEDAPQNMSAGTAHANGLRFEVSASGVLAKIAADVWSGVAVASGTAGWFRVVGAQADAGASSTVLPRLDGNVGTAGANLNLSSTTITATATESISEFQLTYPAQGS